MEIFFKCCVSSSSPRRSRDYFFFYIFLGGETVNYFFPPSSRHLLVACQSGLPDLELFFFAYSGLPCLTLVWREHLMPLKNLSRVRVRVSVLLKTEITAALKKVTKKMQLCELISIADLFFPAKNVLKKEELQGWKTDTCIIHSVFLMSKRNYFLKGQYKTLRQC